MNICAVLINCDDYTSQLSSIFTYDESVLDCDVERLCDVYKISFEEINKMPVDEIIIDRITKLAVDY